MGCDYFDPNRYRHPYIHLNIANMRVLMKRRNFLGALLSSTILPKLAYATTLPFHLKAEPVKSQLAPTGNPLTEMLGFNGSMPGPELRLRQGERLNINFENALSQGSSIHWHGLRINNAMDGVPNLTQAW